ncbi:MAG: Hsp20/alpha crystallin family protein [Candidatus Bathyarchaeia archaeon]|nr:Hsp20/alpha crystallin family protein [Candidatus Bathyarchaeota archaeon]
MSARRRRSIFDLVREYVEEIESLADEIVERFMEKPSWDVASQTLEPLCDVYVSRDNVIVTADLPKADPESIRISSIRDDLIEITAKMKVKVRFEDLGVTHRRGEFTCFCCRVQLPVPVDISKAKAKFVKGILEITLPRKKGYEIKIE